jgi:hypothetical protein
MSAVQKETLKKNPVDPLFTIFEQHLYNFQDSEIDRKTFVNNVVQEYLIYLRKLGISVPKPLEGAIVEELAIQVKAMLVKKIYGCLSIEDYQKKQPLKTKRRARSRYSKIQKTATRTAKPLAK